MIETYKKIESSPIAMVTPFTLRLPVHLQKFNKKQIFVIQNATRIGFDLMIQKAFPRFLLRNQLGQQKITSSGDL